MLLRARVIRGLPMEVEEELNKFFDTTEVQLVHMAQSETGNHISITLIFQEPQLD